MAADGAGSAPIAKGLRTFIALSLGPDARDTLVRAGDDLRREAWAADVRWVRPESLHLTLRFLGETAASSVPRLLDALVQRLQRIEPFTCGLNGLSLFPSASRPRVVAAKMIGEDALAELATAVEDAVVSAGHSADPRRFRPHITLGRFRRPVRRSLAIAAHLNDAPIAVEHVVLLESKLGPGGARYSELGRVALATRAS